jgi:hypothetical protein
MATQRKSKVTASTAQVQNVSENVVPSSDDIDANILLVQQLYAGFSFKCHRHDCKGSLSLGSFKDRIDEWCTDSKASQPNQLSMVSCIECKAKTCVGCGLSPMIGPMRVETPFATVTNCCDRSRLFSIWLILARFDNAESKDRQEAAENSRQSAVSSERSRRFNASAFASFLDTSTPQPAVAPTSDSYGAAWAAVAMNEALEDIMGSSHAAAMNEALDNILGSSEFGLGGTGYADSDTLLFHAHPAIPITFSPPISTFDAPSSNAQSSKSTPDPQPVSNGFSPPQAFHSGPQPAASSSGFSSQAQSSTSGQLNHPTVITNDFASLEQALAAMLDPHLISNGPSTVTQDPNPNLCPQPSSISNGGEYAVHMPISQPALNPRKERQHDFDCFLARSLTLLTAFLPNPVVNDKFDKDPPAELFALFRLSFLFDRLNSVIRNDAIDDIAQRAELYEAVFTFVTAVAKHPLLVSLVTDQRVGKKDWPGLQKMCEDYSKEDATQFFDGSQNGLVASVVSCCRDTHKQAKSF